MLNSVDPDLGAVRAAGKKIIQYHGWADAVIPAQYSIDHYAFLPGRAFCTWRWCLMWYSRRIVGWSMETHLRTELILAALNMAITQRQPSAVIHHSDRGCQYTSYAFGKRCREAGVMPSMGSVGDAYDNAMAESFFAMLARELLNRRRFKSQAEAKMAVFEWIEGWYNVSGWSLHMELLS